MANHLLLLLRTELLRRPGRNLTAVIAIALAASVLLASLAATFTAYDQAPLAGESALAANRLLLRADDLAHPYLDPALLRDLAADPRVASITEAHRVRVIDLPGCEAGGLDVERFYAPGGGNAGWPPQGRTAMWAWQGTPPGKLLEGRWPDPERVDPIELVVPAYVFGRHTRPRHPVGEWRSLESDTGVHRAIVVGVVDAGLAGDFVRDLPSFTISAKAAVALAGEAPAPSEALIELRDADARAVFVADWRPELPGKPGRPMLWDRDTLVEGHRDGFAVRAASSVARTALLLAAASVACIALAVLGSAVRERRAQYRLLRTIGATRSTLISLVLLESTVLAVVGMVGAVLLAWAALNGLAPVLPFIKLSGDLPDYRSIALTFSVVLLGVLAGGAWPAWSAAQSRPADGGEATLAGHRSAETALRCAVAAISVALLAAGVVLMSGPDSPERAELLAWIGVPAVAVVAVLLTPLALDLVARLCLRPVAWLVRSNPLVLEDQFAGDQARSMSSVLAISVGLGAFLLTLCWGASMLEAFVIDERTPRWLVSVHPYGMDRAETERVLAQPDLAALQPLTLVDTRLGDAMAAADDDAADLSCLVVGVDPLRALPPAATALPFRFVAGDAATACREVAAGRACLINDWFADDHALSIGDELRVVVPGRATADGSGDAVYRIAGVVDLHGWRMIFKHNKTRQRNFKQQACVILHGDTVRTDFPVAFANYLIGDALDGPAYPTDLPLEEAFAVSRVAREQVERRIVAQLDLGRTFANNSDDLTTVTTVSRAVMVDDLDRTRHVLRTDWGGNAVQKLGWLPLLALILSLLPVAATQIAAMRARARELGVLRSCGLGRFDLLRLALGECLLVGIAAAFVAVLFGGASAWLLLRVSTIVGWHLRFVGIQPDFVVPWAWLGPGWLLTVAICALAAGFAGWRIGRAAPATLLATPSAARV